MLAINPVKAGLAFGVVMGLFHLGWAVLVAIGLAQAVIDFVLRLHFIQPFIRLQAFDLSTAAALVGFTALVGFVIGAGLALVWNRLRPASGYPLRATAAAESL